MVTKEEFRTTDGLLGVRVVAETKHIGKIQRQTGYFFEKGNKKYFAVCTTDSVGGEKPDPVFEASVKPFRIE